MTDNKEEKKPLDLTTDEALDWLFGEEAANELRGIAHKDDMPPPGDDNGAKMKGNSTRKHGTI